MSYKKSNNILIDGATYEMFEALARERCMPPEILARKLITEALFHQSWTSRNIASGEDVPRHARRRAQPEDDLDEPVVPPDPDDEPASIRLSRRARSQPL